MRVLFGCEFSGIGRQAFSNRGHDAWSCDLLPTELDGQHIQGDIRDILGAGWDLAVFHPPCTYLANSGARWLYKDGARDQSRWDLMREAAEFFRLLWNAPIERIAIENPVPHRYAAEIIGTKYSQIVQPYTFGHPESKATCLWLKNLPRLLSTKLTPEISRRVHRLPPSEDRWKLRARTYEGIADAMAEQWGKNVL